MTKPQFFHNLEHTLAKKSVNKKVGKPMKMKKATEMIARKPSYWYQQSAVVPFRRSAAGLEILLITSRRRKRWILPKGIIEPDMSPQASAAKEAFEEAGVRGRIGTQALGSYKQEKWHGGCHIEVFPFEVIEELDDWPEKTIRKRRWATPEKACELLANEELITMVRRVQRLYHRC